MVDQFDLTLGYAIEDKEWSEFFLSRLAGAPGAAPFSAWSGTITSDVTLFRKTLNSGHKIAIVWSQNFLNDAKFRKLANNIAKQQSEDRTVLPVVIGECDELPTIPWFDFRNTEDFHLTLRTFVQALDLSRQENRDAINDFPKESFDLSERGKRNLAKGKLFESEVAKLYELLGYRVKRDLVVNGMQLDLVVEQERGRRSKDVVECKDTRIGAAERDQIISRYHVFQRQGYGCIAVTSQGYAADARAALDAAGVDCWTYSELLRDLVPLNNYVDRLISDYESERKDKWNDEDWFIRPDLVTDIVYERTPALEHIGRWLGEERKNQLVILGDLGTGKTTLTSFLAYKLANSFRDDPLRQPAPVLVPLKEVRKAFELETIIDSHFYQRGFRDINFPRFEHLVRLGKIILLFDAFDEMADRNRSEVTHGNFRELSRAADLQGKVILTCRTHYFKDRTEQVKVIGQGPKLSETETDLYRELRQRSTAEVVFLQEFDDEKIQNYLRKARPNDHVADWKKIQEIWNLKDLATRPLLLDMIVKSMPRIKAGQPINAASLYNVYTAAWIEREEDKGRKFRLDKSTKLALMIELAWRMWREERQAIHYKELAPFIQKLVDDQKIEIGDEEIADVASEMQGASFLKRDDAGNFSFMHRSFGEFFVAKKIAAALSVSSPTVNEGVNQRVSSPTVNEGLDDEKALSYDRATDTAALYEVLNVRRYDQKTIFFLSQLDEADALREPLQEILRNKYQPQVSENALQLLYWSARIRCGMEEEISDVAKLKAALAGRIPSGAKLGTADLGEVILECADLNSADLTSSNLTKGKLSYGIFDHASFHTALFEEVVIENASVRDADFQYAQLARTTFRESDLTGSDFRNAYVSLESFFNVKLDNVRGLKLPGLVSAKNLLPIVQYGPNFAALAVSYSPDGSIIAAGGSDGNVYIYRSEDGVLLRTLEGHTAQVNSVAFSPDGKTLASGSNDNSVKLWQLNSGKEIRSFRGHSYAVRSVAFSPDGQTLASGSDDNSVKLWQVNSGNEIRSFRGHSYAVRSVAFSPDGQMLASGDSNWVKLWYVSAGKPDPSSLWHSGSVRSVMFSPDGQMLASASDDNSVKLWQLNSGKEIRSLRGHSDGVNSVAFSPDGQTLASGSSDKSVKLWQVNSGKEIRSLSGYSDGVNSVAFSPDGQMLASAGGSLLGGRDNSVKLWQLNSGKEIRSLSGHAKGVLSVAFSPDGQILASGSSDKSVKLWQINSGKEIRPLSGHAHSVRSVAFSPDGQTLASGSDDKSVKLWQLNSGKEIRSLSGHAKGVLSVAFSPDGQTLASGSWDNSVKLWRVNSGKKIRSLSGHSDSVLSVAFSPDGQTLASGSDDKSVKLWQLNSGKEIRSLSGHSGYVRSVAFSPDGQTLASGSSDNSVKLWQVESGKEILSLSGHSSSVLSVAFSPDGQTLASGSYDKSVKLWQVNSGKLLTTLMGNLGAIYSVEFSPDGKYLVSAGVAGRLQFWDLATGESFLYRYHFGPGAWLDLLPDGRFNASPEGMRYLGYTGREELTYYPAESLVKEFYAPEAVAEVLAKYTA